MGNSNALPYDILDSIEYINNNYWQLNNGSKKETKQNVAIFKFSKKERSDRIILAQKNVQKIRTIRHPYVLSYIDSFETEEELILVTEPCTPIVIWFKKAMNDPLIPKQNLFSELTWGFRCILKALDFLHTNCSLFHGNLGLHSIFVTPNGDWKLGSFELACNVSNPDEITQFINYQFILENVYIAPERAKLTSSNDSTKIEEILKAKNPPFYIDIYSFGQCVTKAFIIAQEELKGSLEKYITLTIHPDMKKRPKAKKLLETSIFNSDYIKILENIQEFSLKNPKEILESIAQLDPLLPQMAIAICNHKLLPSVNKVLQISITDFQNRDAREGARQSIVTCIELLSKLASYKKIEEVIFQQDSIQIFIQLWAMTDRTVRTSLLTTLKHLSDLFPNTIVNKHLFDNILAGFSDSNAKLRESTLMSLIYIVEKLDETQLQDRLVRCICNLQNDPEASIRTNAAIFLGKIANKLKEAVRNRVLCNALSKAMKDNFLHCRIAGLKTSLACIKLLEISQIATKIIPTASILLLDKSVDIRNLAITLTEASLERLREYNQFLIDAEREAKEASLNKNKDGNSSNNLNSSGILSTPVAESLLNMHSWTSWLSKTSDGASSNVNLVSDINTSQKDQGNMSDEPYPPSNSSLATTVNHASSDDFSSPFKDLKPAPKAIKPTKGWEDDDLDSALNFSESSNARNTQQTNALSSKPSDDYGFTEDFDDNTFDDEAFNNKLTANFTSSPSPSPSTSSLKVSTKLGGVSSIQTTKDKPVLPEGPKSNSKASKLTKVAVKKLEFSKEDNWDDF